MFETSCCEGTETNASLALVVGKDYISYPRIGHRKLAIESDNWFPLPSRKCLRRIQDFRRTVVVILRLGSIRPFHILPWYIAVSGGNQTGKTANC